MSENKKSFQTAAKQIDEGLGGLFGALNEALGEMVARLEDGTSGAVERDLTFDTEKGPVRAQAGVRLRMGGMDVNTATSAPKPVNPGRTKPKAPDPVPRTLSYDIFEDEDAWVLTADLPGVSRKDVQLTAEKTRLQIKTNGARQYAGSVDLETTFDVESITPTLRNGILTLRIPKGDAS